MKILSANSYRNLIAFLSHVNLDVPQRGDKESKRTTDHVERWSICRFLATYGNTRFIRYPLFVEKRERPDYRLNSRGLTIGIEVTEAVSQDMARIDAMRHAEEDPVVLDASLFRPGTPTRTVAELRAILEHSRVKDPTAEDGVQQDDDGSDPIHNRIMGPGWAGDGVERDWADALFGVINKKSESARKPGYTFFDETWLLVYDNLSLPMLNIPRAMNHLLPILAPIWPHISFKHVFIEHGKEIVRISAPEYGTRALNDLWRVE